MTTMMTASDGVAAKVEHCTYFMNVSYDTRLSEMIAAGKYEWSNGGITAQHFPPETTGRKRMEVRLFRFERPVASYEVIQAVEAQGMRPATLPELLAFGAQFPDVQEKFRIVALGSAWWKDGNRHVPYLHTSYGESRGRTLNTGWWGRLWDKDCRFAVISMELVLPQG